MPRKYEQGTINISLDSFCSVLISRFLEKIINKFFFKKSGTGVSCRWRVSHSFRWAVSAFFQGNFRKLQIFIFCKKTDDPVKRFTQFPETPQTWLLRQRHKNNIFSLRKCLMTNKSIGCSSEFKISGIDFMIEHK